MTPKTKAISLKNVTKRYGETTAVSDLSLEVGTGEVVGFLGPNGAGKTTTVRMISGFVAPDAGEVFVHGLNVLDQGVEIKRRIGYLPENNPLYPDMLVSEYLSFIADIKGIAKKERGERLDAVVPAAGIGDVFFRSIGELSKGYRQRVGLAQAIIHDPDILILDEPTEGLDPNQRVEIRQLVQELGKRATVLVSTHVLQEVQATCNRVIIVDKGSLVADDSIEKIAAMAQSGKRIIVELEGKGAARKIGALKGVLGIETESGRKKRQRIVVTSSPEVDLRPEIFTLAKDSGWLLWELYQVEDSLESAFRVLTSGEEDVSENLDNS